MSKKVAVDVICQHSKDGRLIPMRLRLSDESGENQTYTIKEYRDISVPGTQLLPNGIYVTNNTFVFECAITVFGAKKLINLYYELNDPVWHMSY